MSAVSNQSTIIPGGNLFAPHTLGSIKLTHDGREFSVIDSEGLESAIQRANLSSELRGISRETLQKMLQVGYLSVRKYENDYSLRFDTRLLGGMFSPKTWGGGAAAFFGRGFVYKAGEVMGHSDLHVAVTQGWEKDVKRLIQEGADVNMINSKGNTPLDDAIRERHVVIEGVLKEHGALRSNELITSK